MPEGSSESWPNGYEALVDENGKKVGKPVWRKLTPEESVQRNEARRRQKHLNYLADVRAYEVNVENFFADTDFQFVIFFDAQKQLLLSIVDFVLTGKKVVAPIVFIHFFHYPAFHVVFKHKSLVEVSHRHIGGVVGWFFFLFESVE